MVVRCKYPDWDSNTNDPPRMVFPPCNSARTHYDGIESMTFSAISTGTVNVSLLAQSGNIIANKINSNENQERMTVKTLKRYGFDYKEWKLFVNEWRS